MAVAIDKLKRRASGLQKIGAQRRRNHAGSWSGPVAVVRSEKSSDFDKIWYTKAYIEPDDSHVTKN